MSYSYAKMRWNDNNGRITQTDELSCFFSPSFFPYLNCVEGIILCSNIIFNFHRKFLPPSRLHFFVMKRERKLRRKILQQLSGTKNDETEKKTLLFMPLFDNPYYYNHRHHLNFSQQWCKNILSKK